MKITKQIETTTQQLFRTFDFCSGTVGTQRIGSGFKFGSMHFMVQNNGNMVKIVVLCLVVFAFVNVACDSVDKISAYKTIETHDGIVRGRLNYTLFHNTSYYSFLGIPYAEKPINDLRFKAPISIPPWKPNIFNAYQYGNSCIQQQLSAIDDIGPQSEDCLYLNIFVPANRKPHKKLAVIFFIHGGGFAYGSSNNFFYGPDFLLEQDVILVLANYRLGAFGFMSLNRKSHSGNMGLKDQQMALKWTHRNIRAFGGDRRRITLMGHSAGAVSVHLHVLLPQSRNLIRGAICLSGSAFLRYTYLDERNHFKKMLAFAQKTNSTISHLHELIDFLKHVPASAIVSGVSQVSMDRTLILDWAPVLEKKSAVHPIMVKTPDEMYESNLNVNVDMMFGFTNYECLELVWADVQNSSRLNDFLNTFNLELPVHRLKPQFKSRSYRKLLNKVRDYYFGNVTNDNDKAIQLVKMISDLNMITPIDRAVRTQAKQSKRPTYYYRFSIDGKLDYVKRRLNAKWPGVAAHGDDLCYIFRCHSIDPVYQDVWETMHRDESSKISYNTIQLMTEMYANFAKYGRPSVLGQPIKRFQPVRDHKINFLDITNAAAIPDTSPNKDVIKFWNRILQNAEMLIR